MGNVNSELLNVKIIVILFLCFPVAWDDKIRSVIAFLNLNISNNILLLTLLNICFQCQKLKAEERDSIFKHESSVRRRRLLRIVNWHVVRIMR